jgi:hypothetical protein
MIAVITYIEVYPDGSGAPALVDVGPYRYSMNYHGKQTLNVIVAPRGKESIQHRNQALRVAHYVYAKRLQELIDDKWMDANHTMYKDCIQ